MNTSQAVTKDFNFENGTDCFAIPVPKEFSYDEILRYLTRSAYECLHHVENRKVYKLLQIEQEPVLIEISSEYPLLLHVRFVNGKPLNHAVREIVSDYIREWFDLERDLKPFYDLAADDKLLGKLARDYFGLRIVGIPDLFEALCWAVIGQQINLHFAYILKKRFTEQYGRSLIWNENRYWLFPKPSDIAHLSPDQLRTLQFTAKKAEYIIQIAKMIENGTLSKKALLELNDFESAERHLLSIRGIGPWSAHYVMMRCLRNPRAFPIGDAGLHQAVNQLLCLNRKPSKSELEQLFKEWVPWEAYAVFYLWRSLIDNKEME